MAGRQFSFFIGPSDQKGVEDAIRSVGDVIFLRDWPLSSNPEEVDTTIISEDLDGQFRTLVARSFDLPDLDFRPINSRVEFSCDLDQSLVIEFTRFPWVIDGNFLRAGRLYRIDKYWDGSGTLLSKSPSFIKWSEQIYKAVKASLSKIEQGCFAGAEAMEMRRNGIAFEGIDIATNFANGRPVQ